eukprot:2899802-Prymnesium_polylepis.1
MRRGARARRASRAASPSCCSTAGAVRARVRVGVVVWVMLQHRGRRGAGRVSGREEWVGEASRAPRPHHPPTHHHAEAEHTHALYTPPSLAPHHLGEGVDDDRVGAVLERARGARRALEDDPVVDLVRDELDARRVAELTPASGGASPTTAQPPGRKRPNAAVHAASPNCCSPCGLGLQSRAALSPWESVRSRGGAQPLELARREHRPRR